MPATRTKKKPKEQTMIGVLRKIRSKLTGDVKKVDKYSYSVNGKALVTLTYFCRWNAVPKVCTPHTITVKIHSEFTNGRKRPTSSVFSTRSFQQRADGSYNYDSVLVAITKCLESVDCWSLQVDEDRKSEALRKKTKQQAIESLGKSLPKKGRKKNYSGFSYENPEIRIHVSLNDDMKPEYSFDCETGSVSSIKKMFAAARK